MRLLRRNTTLFDYYAYNGKTEALDNGRHTGRYEVTYKSPVTYRGTVDLPSGYVSRELFGIDTDYTHVLVMDRPDADITESGRILWDGKQFEIKAVRKSLNALSVAMKILPERGNWIRPQPEPVPEPAPEPETVEAGDGE